MQKTKKHMKNRQVELCGVKGCPRYLQPFSDLTSFEEGPIASLKSTAKSRQAVTEST